MDLEAHVLWSITLLGVRSTEVCFPSLQTDLKEHGFKEQISTIQMEGPDWSVRNNLEGS